MPEIVADFDSAIFCRCFSERASRNFNNLVLIPPRAHAHVAPRGAFSPPKGPAA